jgi:hypothetical protein
MLSIDNLCYQTTLGLFRRRDLYSVFKESYVERKTTLMPNAGESQNKQLPPSSDCPQDAGPSAVTSANFWVEPPSAAQYFDSISNSDVGDWRVLISTRAERALRDACKGDAETFRIRIKKIMYVQLLFIIHDSYILTIACSYFTDFLVQRVVQRTFLPR